MQAAIVFDCLNLEVDNQCISNPYFISKPAHNHVRF